MSAADKTTHIVFSKLDTRGVSLQNLLDQLGNAALIFESPRVVPCNPSVVGRESSLDLVLQQSQSVGTHFGVILNVLNEPPCELGGLSV